MGLQIVIVLQLSTNIKGLVKCSKPSGILPVLLISDIESSGNAKSIVTKVRYFVSACLGVVYNEIINYIYVLYRNLKYNYE